MPTTNFIQTEPLKISKVGYVTPSRPSLT